MWDEAGRRAAGKLVRDRIPELIRADGLAPVVRAAKAEGTGAFSERLVWHGNRDADPR